ncbi:MAG TPA: CocE/NonD family hydrolase [Pseudonocardiaceae bacterium]
MRRLLLVVVLVALLPALPAAAVPPRPVSTPVHETTDSYSYANAIRQSAWVDTGHGRVVADIIRPRELDRTAKIPVIMEAGPYFTCCGRGNQLQTKTYSAGNPVGFPLFYDNYFVPRGYAVVLVDLAGTGRSPGCVDAGGPSDIRSASAVIDWLNGRGTAYTSLTSAVSATAYWSDGNVGMIGKSWDGTIAEGVASTGIAGLKTIVPIASISDWYDYFRASGAPLARENLGSLAAVVSSCAVSALNAGSPANGDFTPTYAARDYVTNAGKVRASVFIANGLNDHNVPTINFGQWWQALPPSVPKMIWLSQAGHVDPFDYRRTAWVNELHRWFDHYLMGIDNGVEYDPQAAIERAPDQWVSYAAWPIPGTRATVWHPTPGTLGPVAATLGTSATFTDGADRLSYSTAPLTRPTTISGTVTITLTVSSSTSDARLSAFLVDHGPTTIRADAGGGITTLATKSCWGDSTATDSACYFNTAPNTVSVSDDVFDRGWADLGHYATLANKQPLTPGRPYTITFPMNSTDHTIPAGHTLSLIIGGTDNGYIDGPSSHPTLTVDLAASSVLLPLAR